MKTISFINLIKGGVGKSTLAINVAAQLHSSLNDVMILDLDSAQKASYNWALKAGISTLVNPEYKVISRLLEDKSKYLIFDTGGYDLASSQALISVSDVVLIPISISEIETAALIVLMEKINKIKTLLNKDNLNLVIVPNRIGTQYKYSDKVVKHFQKLEKLGYKIAPTIYNRSVYEKTYADGKSVIHGTDAKARTEIYNLTEFIKSL